MSKRSYKHPYDQFRTFCSRIWDRYSKAVVIGSSLLLVAVISHFIYHDYQSRQSLKANDLLSQAYHLVRTQEPAAGQQVSIIQLEKNDEKLKSFQAILKQLNEQHPKQEITALGSLLTLQVNKDSACDEQGINNITAKSKSIILPETIYQAQAFCYMQKTQFKEAIEPLKAILALNDQHILKDSALYQLGVLYEELGMQQEAKQSYQQLIDEYADSSYKRNATFKILSM